MSGSGLDARLTRLKRASDDLRASGALRRRLLDAAADSGVVLPGPALVATRGILRTMLLRGAIFAVAVGAGAGTWLGLTRDEPPANPPIVRAPLVIAKVLEPPPPAPSTPEQPREVPRLAEAGAPPGEPTKAKGSPSRQPAPVVSAAPARDVRQCDAPASSTYRVKPVTSLDDEMLLLRTTGRAGEEPEIRDALARAQALSTSPALGSKAVIVALHLTAPPTALTANLTAVASEADVSSHGWVVTPLLAGPLWFTLPGYEGMTVTVDTTTPYMFAGDFAFKPIPLDRAAELDIEVSGASGSVEPEIVLMAEPCLTGVLGRLSLPHARQVGRAVHGSEAAFMGLSMTPYRVRVSAPGYATTEDDFRPPHPGSFPLAIHLEPARRLAIESVVGASPAELAAGEVAGAVIAPGEEFRPGVHGEARNIRVAFRHGELLIAGGEWTGRKLGYGPLDAFRQASLDPAAPLDAPLALGYVYALRSRDGRTRVLMRLSEAP